MTTFTIEPAFASRLPVDDHPLTRNITWRASMNAEGLMAMNDAVAQAGGNTHV